MGFISSRWIFFPKGISATGQSIIIAVVHVMSILDPLLHGLFRFFSKPLFLPSKSGTCSVFEVWNFHPRMGEVEILLGNNVRVAKLQDPVILWISTVWASTCKQGGTTLTESRFSVKNQARRWGIPKKLGFSERLKLLVRGTGPEYRGWVLMVVGAPQTPPTPIGKATGK